MSQFVAIIKKINSVDTLNIVEFDFHGITLKMMSLDLNENIKVGKKVKLAAKATNVIIARNLSGDISLSNRIIATVESINSGKLLCSIKLRTFDTTLESIITNDSANSMNLNIGDEVIVLIKASNLSIEEVLDD